MLENLRGGGPALREGEVTRTHRVRAGADVQVWFASMSAEQRGELLAQAMAGQEKREGAWTPGRRLKAPSRPSGGLEGITELVVAGTQVPQLLKNDLRWSPDRYTALEARLAGADRVTLHQTNGKAVWRTPDGEAMRKDTVVRLVGAGVLRP